MLSIESTHVRLEALHTGNEIGSAGNEIGWGNEIGTTSGLSNATPDFPWEILKPSPEVGTNGK